MNLLITTGWVCLAMIVILFVVGVVFFLRFWWTIEQTDRRMEKHRERFARIEIDRSR